MDTSEYTTRKERKQAKRLTRHVLFQRMRARAVDAEAQIILLRIDLTKALVVSKQALEAGDAMKGEVDRLNAVVEGLQGAASDAL